MLTSKLEHLNLWALRNSTGLHFRELSALGSIYGVRSLLWYLLAVVVEKESGAFVPEHNHTYHHTCHHSVPGTVSSTRSKALSSGGVLLVCALLMAGTYVRHCFTGQWLSFAWLPPLITCFLCCTNSLNHIMQVGGPTRTFSSAVFTDSTYHLQVLDRSFYVTNYGRIRASTSILSHRNRDRNNLGTFSRPFP